MFQSNELINYKVGYKFMRVAKKSYVCEKCGKEIPKGDHYWNWKPLPNGKYWFTWRKRCIDCEPRYYDEVNHYENHHARVPQIRKVATI